MNSVWVLSTSLPQSVEGRSVGLLGRMDGNATNDFTNAAGDQLEVEAVRGDYLHRIQSKLDGQ